jgi:hypothetical protein
METIIAAGRPDSHIITGRNFLYSSRLDGAQTAARSSRFASAASATENSFIKTKAFASNNSRRRRQQRSAWRDPLERPPDGRT